MVSIQHILQKKGLKATAQRILVYHALQQLEHATVDAVAGKVRTKMPTITIATVYNILEAMAKAGLIGRLYTVDNKIAYDITSEPHNHLFDIETMDIKDYDNNELSNMIREYLEGKSIPGFSLEGITIHFLGKFQ